jgi:octaprenyl-diphosphate synthase
MVEAGNIAVLGILADASAVIASGEVLQLKSTNNLATREADYLEIVSAKTAALFSAAAEAGATLGERSRTFVSAFRDYGKNLGIAFQLVDDALDYSGRAQLMGKAVGDDFREAKATLPVILAYARADDRAKPFWERVIADGSQHDGDLDQAIAYVEETGAIGETMIRAKAYAARAGQALAFLPSSPLQAALVAVAEFCVARVY